MGFPGVQELLDVAQHFRALGVQRGDFVHDFLRAAVRDFLAAVGVLHGQIKRLRVDGGHFHAPAFGRVGFGLLQRDELGEVGVVERVGLAHVAAGVELIEPDFTRLCAFLKEEHHGLHARADKRAAGAVEHGVEVAFFEEFLAQADGGVVGVGQEGVLDDDAGAATGLEDFDEVLEEQKRGFARADREILLDLFAFLAAKRRIGDDDVVAVFLLNVGKVFSERVGVDDVGRFDAVQDHVHDPDDVGEGLLFLPVEGALLQGAVLGGGALGVLGAEVIEGFAEEAGRADGGVADGLADFRIHDRDDGSNERARGVVFAAVAPGVAHVFDLGFVEVREFVLLGLGREAEFVDVVDDLAQVVAALDAVFDLTEDFADLVFDGVRAGGLGLEAVQVGEELAVDEGDEVVAGEGGVVVDLAVLFRRSPSLPAVGGIEDVGVFLAVEGGFGGLVVLEGVEVFQEEEPGGLLGVIEFAGAAGVFPEDVVDVFEGLFEHGVVG